MLRRLPGCRNCWAFRARSANSIVCSPIGSRKARSVWKRRRLPIICGRPPWTSSRSISRIMRRTRGRWRAKVANTVIPGCAERRPGISRFRVRRCATPRNDEAIPHCEERQRRSNPALVPMQRGLDPLARNDGEDTVRTHEELLPNPFRRTLLGKCLRSLDIILRRRHRCYRGVLALFFFYWLRRHREPFLNRLLGGADRHRAVLADGLGPALGGSQRFAGWNHLVHKTEFMAFLCGDMTRGEDHAHGTLQPDLARQPV